MATTRQYRGYDIVPMRQWSQWCVGIYPTRADLPILARSTLSNLAGYRILYGTSAGSLNKTIQVANAGTMRYVVENLATGTWYFSVRAYSSTGAESTASNTASKAIP